MGDGQDKRSVNTSLGICRLEEDSVGLKASTMECIYRRALRIIKTVGCCNKPWGRTSLGITIWGLSVDGAVTNNKDVSFGPDYNHAFILRTKKRPMASITSKSYQVAGKRRRGSPWGQTQRRYAARSRQRCLFSQHGKHHTSRVETYPQGDQALQSRNPQLPTVRPGSRRKVDVAAQQELH